VEHARAVLKFAALAAFLIGIPSALFGQQPANCNAGGEHPKKYE
jgi:hypothetical protein